MIREGRDPLAEKRKAIAARQRPRTPTFAEAAATVIEMRRPTWSNSKHAAQWNSTLETYAFPKIGSKLVTDITSADILAALSPIWTEKPETVSRVRQRIETGLDWVVAQGYRIDNPANRSIAKVLPRMPRTKQHHQALHYRDVPQALELVLAKSASGTATHACRSIRRTWHCDRLLEGGLPIVSPLIPVRQHLTNATPIHALWATLCAGDCRR